MTGYEMLYLFSRNEVTKGGIIMANIHFFYGTMAAGKSSHLIQEHYNFTQKGVNVWAIKPGIDRTDKPIIQSRIGLECPATIMKQIKLKDIIKMEKFYSTVYLIDELQFFKPKDIDSLVKLADTYDKLVFCYGLMVDVNEKLFPASKHLIEVGAQLHELKTSCQNGKCMNTADHHIRYDLSGHVILDGKSVDVDDGHIIYQSVCRQCYNNLIQQALEERKMHKM